MRIAVQLPSAPAVRTTGRAQWPILSTDTTRLREVMRNRAARAVSAPERSAAMSTADRSEVFRRAEVPASAGVVQAMGAAADPGERTFIVSLAGEKLDMERPKMRRTMLNT